MKVLTENLWQISVDKAKLVKQDNLVTRQKFEAKDQAMQILQKEAHKLLKEKDDTIHALEARVQYYLICWQQLFNQIVC